MKTYENWKADKISEDMNYAKMGQATGDTTMMAGSANTTTLSGKIKMLLSKKMRQADRDNPGSTTDPGRMNMLKDEFIRELMAVVVHVVRGDDAGSGRSVNYRRGSLRNSQMQQPAPQKAMGQGSQQIGR